MNSQEKKALTLLVIVLAIIAISIETVLFFYGESKGVKLHFFDVGQGDSTMLTLDGTKQILIDGGRDGKKLLSFLGQTISPLDKQLEIVVLTHPDQDHLAGLIDVVDVYDVGVFLHNGQEADTEIFRQLKNKLDENRIRQEVLGEGSRLLLGDQLEMAVFNPDVVSEGQRDRNEHSVVLRIDYGKNSFLLTGDADKKTESDLLSDLEDVDVDWLKVGHHGSKYSTNQEFLQIVSPNHAIISVGKNNRYGHPDSEVLERLQNIGAKILRTDQQGTIIVKCENPESLCIAM